MWDLSAASELDLRIDAISLQVVGEVIPVVGVLQGGFYIISHFVSHPFIGTESLCPCLGFAFTEGQTVFLFQFLADAVWNNNESALACCASYVDDGPRR